MKKLILFSLLCTAILTSCFREYNCPSGNINITLRGYDTLSVDTLIIKQYKSGSNFSEYLSTQTIIVQDLESLASPNEDQCYLFSPIEVNSDWEIITNNNNYKINGYTVNKKTTKKTMTGCNEKNCTSPCSQIHLNNTPTSLDIDLQVIYLDK